MKNKFTRVEHILYNMFIEDTGIHMLDSGMLDGRHFQKNQKLKIDDFVNREMVTYDQDDDSHVIDTFKFLSNRLYVDDETDELNKLFNEFMNREENKDESYFKNTYDFIIDFIKDENYISNNTYNFDELLNQDYEFFLFEYNNKTYVIIHLHNGADIRGGYTKPYIFKIDAEYLIYPETENELKEYHKEYYFNECLCVGVEE